MLEIAAEDPDQPEVIALLKASDAYVATLYPAESNHMLDLAALQAPEVTFLVVRNNGQAIGCGALVKSGKDWAEIKRMFVSPSSRGQKLGRRLLDALETIAIESGFTLLRLETGVSQPEALSLYRSAGFVKIDPFGEYRPDPLSVFLEKKISSSEHDALAGEISNI